MFATFSPVQNCQTEEFIFSYSDFRLLRVCGEHKSSSASLKKRGRPRKTAALQTEVWKKVIV